MEADAAEVGGLVDDGDAVSEFGSFDGGVVAGGAASDYQEVVVIRGRGFGAHFDLIVPQLRGMAVIR